MIEELPYEEGKPRIVKLQCDCGKIIVRPFNQLSSGARSRYATKSCGCLKSEATRTRSWKGCGDIPASVRYRIRAHGWNRGYECTLTIHYLSMLYESQGRRCAISGVPLFIASSMQKVEKRRYHTASLDRIDSTRGYVFGNIHWVHKDINLMKNTLPLDEFLIRCASVAEHNAAKIATLDREERPQTVAGWRNLRKSKRQLESADA